MKTPVHLWIIGILSLIWNAGGGYDYVMTQTSNQEYLSALTDLQRAHFDNVPMWFEFAWAIGVWFSIIGSLLLLVRSRFAAPVFFVSLLGLIGGTIYTFGMAEPSGFAMGTTVSYVFTVAIFVVLILLWVYSRAMVRRGVLR